ncbi:hypothetical protein BGX21_002968 [Mortierella sp. AD011]|nr:hypothetical protein BGX21_002968 [Mortierella sp. AD011]
MSVSEEKLEQLWESFLDTLRTPFLAAYEENWVEEPYWAAVEAFKAKALEIGFEDPISVLSEYGLTSYENFRDKLKAGPPKFTREGWVSPVIGSNWNVVNDLSKLSHVGGPKFHGTERIIILDFWATWCEPCVAAAPRFSDLAEKHAGVVSVIGINNESMFRPMKYDPESVKSFIEERKESFRYPNYVDTEDNKFTESVPCAILIVDQVVTCVGNIEASLKKVLEEDLVKISATIEQ